MSEKSINRRLKKRSRQILRSRRGHALQSKRRARKYSPEKWRDSLFVPEVTRNLVQRRTKSQTKIVLNFPAICSIKENSEEVCLFLRALEDAFFITRARTVIIDHSVMEEVTPEAALVLIAELWKLLEYSPKTRLHGLFKGAKPEVLSILGEVGYLKYFGIDPPSKTDGKKHFVEHTTGIITWAEPVAHLVTKFYTNGHLPLDRCRRLVKGLIECMQNVSHHAYRRASGRKLMGRWWLLGYIDEESGEIYFAFYDQGVGIPTTLRFKFRDRVLPELFGRSGCELIVAAFNGRYSSTKKGNRGLGLPGLKRLVDEAPNGELFVQSKECRVLLKPRVPPTTKEMKNPLEGTLLVWQILVSQNNDHDSRKSHPREGS